MLGHYYFGVLSTGNDFLIDLVSVSLFTKRWICKSCRRSVYVEIWRNAKGHHLRQWVQPTWIHLKQRPTSFQRDPSSIGWIPLEEPYQLLHVLQQQSLSLFGLYFRFNIGVSSVLHEQKNVTLDKLKSTSIFMKYESFVTLIIYILNSMNANEAKSKWIV